MPALDPQADALRALLERQLERATRYLQRAHADGRFDEGVAAAKAIADELADILDRTFGEVSVAYERASQAIYEANAAELDAQGIPAAFSEQSAASLRAQVDGTLGDIATIADEATAELRTLIEDVVRSAVPPDEALDALVSKLNGKVSQAATLVDTGLAAFDRAVMTQQSTEAGVEWFLYDGPKDKLTRPYCDARVGKRFTLAMLDATPNDVGPNPPSLYCGGYNCRHRLTPLLLTADLAAIPVGS